MSMQSIKRQCSKIFAAVLMFAMAIGLFAGTGVGMVDAKAAAADSGISIIGKDGKKISLEKWTYQADTENPEIGTFNNPSGKEVSVIKDFTKSEYQTGKAGSEDYDITKTGALVYSGTQPKGSWQSGTRLAVVTKGILLEDLIDYASELAGGIDLRGDTHIKYGAESYKGSTAGQVVYMIDKPYKGWYDQARYYYPDYWDDANADTNQKIYSGDNFLSDYTGQYMPYSIAVVGFTAQKSDWTSGGWTSLSDEIAAADSQKALRNFLGQLPNIGAAESDNINLGNLSTQNIQDILFEPVYYNIAITDGTNSGEAGTDLTTAANHATVTMSDYWLKGANGESISFTVTPDDGYQTTAVSAEIVGGSALEVTEDNGTYSFSMPADDVTISVQTQQESNAELSVINGDSQLTIAAADIAQFGERATKSFSGKNGATTVDTVFLNVKDYLEASDFDYSKAESFTLMAKDGFTVDIPIGQVEELFVYVQESGTIRSAVDGSAGRFWVSDIVSITVNPLLNRIYGKTRYETSISIADTIKAANKGAQFDSVIITTGEEFADALCGSYLAKKKNAPILIINPAVEETIKNVTDYVNKNLSDKGTVYILGGSVAVPETVEDMLSADTVTRLGGEDRYETNLKILEAAGVDQEEILVSTGSNFADSLSASAAGKPILLVKNELNDSQKAWLGSLEKRNYYIIGGTSAVDESMESQLADYAQEITRIGGATRYETSAMVAETFFDKPAKAVLAVGSNFPDGLCGGPLALTEQAPLVLVNDSTYDAAASYCEEAGISGGYVLGGPTLISDETAETVLQVQ